MQPPPQYVNQYVQEVPQYVQPAQGMSTFDTAQARVAVVLPFAVPAVRCSSAHTCAAHRVRMCAGQPCGVRQNAPRPAGAAIRPARAHCAGSATRTESVWPCMPDGASAVLHPWPLLGGAGAAGAAARVRLAARVRTCSSRPSRANAAADDDWDAVKTTGSRVSCASLCCPTCPAWVLNARLSCVVRCRRRAECRPGIQRGTISTSGEMQRSATRGSRQRRAQRRRWIRRHLGECSEFRCHKMLRTHIFRALASRRGEGAARRSMCQRRNTPRKWSMLRSNQSTPRLHSRLRKRWTSDTPVHSFAARHCQAQEHVESFHRWL